MKSKPFISNDNAFNTAYNKVSELFSLGSPEKLENGSIIYHIKSKAKSMTRVYDQMERELNLMGFDYTVEGNLLTLFKVSDLLKSSYDSFQSEEWIPKDLVKGDLHKKLNISEKEDIPVSKINAEADRLKKKYEDTDEKWDKDDLKFFRQLNFAKVMKSKSGVLSHQDAVIDGIEEIEMSLSNLKIAVKNKDSEAAIYLENIKEVAEDTIYMLRGF